MTGFSEKAAKQNIAALAMAGFRWNAYFMISLTLMQVLFGIILARLLSPEAFGVYFYAMIFVGLIQVYAEAGISEAIIQRQQLTHTHVAAGFTLIILIGLSATIGLWVLAPLIANDTQTPVVRAVSFLFILSAFGAVSGALLEKHLDFRRRFWIEVISYGMGQGVIGIGLAMMGYGVWSLVSGLLMYAFIRSALRVWMAPHSIQFSLERSAVKELMHFGVGRSLTRLANYGAQQGDYFVIGRRLLPEALGSYSLAYQIARIPTSQIASVISSVLFPVYAAVHGDQRRQRKGWYLSISVVSFVTFPLMVWLCISARKLILTVYGPAWIDSIRSLEILPISGVFASIYTLCDALVTARGHVYAQFARHSIYAAMVIIGAMLGIGYGIEGVAFAVTAAVFIMYILMAQLSITVVGGSWRDFLTAQVPGVVAGIGMALVSGAVMLIGEQYVLSDIIILAALTLSCAAVYPIALVALPLSCLGEIPGLLLTRCSSFVPRQYLHLLSRRLKKVTATDGCPDIQDVVCDTTFTDRE